MPAKVAVIGAGSFSGRAFVRFLAGMPKYQVLPFTRDNLDLLSPKDATEFLTLNQFDYVVNFAALNMVAESWAHYQDYYATNVIGVASLVGDLLDRGWRGRWVQVSTPEVYGSVEGRISEGQRFAPSTPYAVSRAACDMHLMALRNTKGLDVVFTRTVNVYGPSQQLYRIIPKTILSILRKQKLYLDGGGHSERSFIHVDDMASAIERVMVYGLKGNDYHVATPFVVTIRHLVAMICEEMGVPIESLVVDVADRPGKDRIYLLDDSKIRSSLGWHETISLEAGVQRTVAWFSRNASAFEGASLNYEHNHGKRDRFTEELPPHQT